MSHLWIAQTTVANVTDAKALASSAVSQNLAACVQLDPGVLSIFIWDGEQVEDPEVRLTFKTTAARLPALKAMVMQEHPYEVPEWIAWPLGDVQANYLAWAEERVIEDEED